MIIGDGAVFTVRNGVSAMPISASASVVFLEVRKKADEGVNLSVALPHSYKKRYLVLFVLPLIVPSQPTTAVTKEVSFAA